MQEFLKDQYTMLSQMTNDEYKALCKNVDQNSFIENYTLDEQTDIWFYRDVTSHLYTFDFRVRCQEDLNKIKQAEVLELYKKLF